MGGAKVDIKDYPYAVSLKKLDRRSKKFQHHCGGTLVGNSYVITAAHCVVQNDATKYRIAIGVQDTRNADETRTYKVESILVYPEYSSSKNRGIDHDIALIKLETPVTSTDYAQPINLIDGDKIPATDGILVGWGADGWGSEGSPTYELNRASMPIKSNTECIEMLNTVLKKKYKNGKIVYISEGHLCAGHHQGGIDGCQGDSGAGLVIENGGDMELVGIMSAGSACGRPYKPGVYTRVSEYRDWITTNMQ